MNDEDLITHQTFSLFNSSRYRHFHCDFHMEGKGRISGLGEKGGVMWKRGEGLRETQVKKIRVGTQGW